MIVAEEIRQSSLGERINLVDSRKFTSKFIEPGLVSYRDQPGGGLELLRKETIDRCLASAIHNPVTIGHVSVDGSNRAEHEQGVVQDVSYNANDGWYYCTGEIDTDRAKELIRRGHRPSCAYSVLEFGPGGVYHGIRYDREITEINFLHLAIVEKPRYEEAFFRLNSKNKMFKFLRKLITRANAEAAEVETTQAHEVSGETTVEVDGVPVRLNDLAAVWKTQKGQVFEASMDDVCEIDGESVKLNEMVSAYRKSRENSVSKGEKAEKAKEDAKPQTKENAAPVAPVAAAAAPAPEVKENAAPVVPATAPAAAAPEVKENAINDPFAKLASARENGYEAPTLHKSPNTRADRIRKGQERFGSVTPVSNN